MMNYLLLEVLIIIFSPSSLGKDNVASRTKLIRTKVKDQVVKDFNSYSEELLIRPLATGHVYSHFEYTTSWSNPSIRKSIEEYADFDFPAYDLFPRAFGEVVERYHVRELHLSLTQGIWRHPKWGYPVQDVPPGALLWVWFNPTPKELLDQTWRDLVNALSGLFCASLNFIDTTNTASPKLSFRPAGLAEQWYAQNSSYLRTAALARENVCTENLTPWKKLLPCHSKAGLASILYPGPLFSSNYLSLSINMRPTCQDKESCLSAQLELALSVSVVQKKLQDGRQDFSLRHLYSSPLYSSCPLAHSSFLYVDITGNEDMSHFSLTPNPDNVLRSGYTAEEKESAAHRTLAVYNLQELLNRTREPVNIAARYSKPLVYGLVPSPPLLATRYIAGFGQESGSIRVLLTNSSPHNISVVYLELLPWYLRLYLHPSHQHSSTQRLSELVLARDREQGWVYESVVLVPASSTIELSMHFTRALLKWLEYPPDANHGFYLPAATISFSLSQPMNVSVNCLDTRSLLEKLQVVPGKSFVRIHTETLLVSLPTPDFSMPYNVICLACTVVALAFGPIHNITTKRLTLKKVERSSSLKSSLLRKVSRLLGRRADVSSLQPTSDSSAADMDGGAADSCAEEVRDDGTPLDPISSASSLRHRDTLNNDR